MTDEILGTSSLLPRVGESEIDLSPIEGVSRLAAQPALLFGSLYWKVYDSANGAQYVFTTIDDELVFYDENGLSHLIETVDQELTVYDTDDAPHIIPLVAFGS